MEINLRKLATLLLKKWFIIVLCTILSGGTAFTLSKLMITQQYTATSLLYVDLLHNGNSSSVTSGNLSTAQKLVDTYIVILTSDTFLESVSKDCNLNYSAGQIRGMLDMKAVNNTEVFRVSVTLDNQDEALTIAQSIKKLSKPAIEDAIDSCSLKVVDQPKVSPISSTRKVMTNTVLAVLIAFVSVCFLIILYDKLDFRIKGEEDLERYQIPVLGSVPRLK